MTYLIFLERSLSRRIDSQGMPMEPPPYTTGGEPLIVEADSEPEAIAKAGVIMLASLVIDAE